MRSRTALSLFVLLAVSASGRATPFGIAGEANLTEPAAIAEIVVEDVESAPAGLPALDHLVKVEQVLQGSVPGTSLIVRVPVAQISPALRPGGRAVLALAPARDGSFRLLHVVREGPPGEAVEAGMPAIPERPDRADPADWSLGPLAHREPEAGWSAAEKIVTGIFEGNGFVSTLAALNLERVGGKVTVILRDAEGELVGDPAALLLGPRILRLQPLIRMFPDMVSRRGPFTIELVSNGIHFAASAILLEIESEDEIFIPASAMEVAGTATSGEMFFPRVVHSHGPFDTLLTSRLIAFNPAEEGRLLTLEFWERGQDNMAPRTAYRYVEPGRSLRVDDVLLDLFGQEEGIGALRITWSGPAGPAPRVVTLMFAGTAGGQGKRFGTLVEAATGAGAIRSRGVVPGAGQTPTSRSSVGLVNLSSASTDVRLMLKDAAGDLLATTWLSLKPRQHLERNLAGLFPGLGNGEGWGIETEVVVGGPVLAYLTRIDAGGDIFYVPAHER
jgi:hypothetical protein